MLVYNLLYGLILIGLVVSGLKFHLGLNKLYWITSMLIIGIIGFRDETFGTDTYEYLQFFLNPDNRATYYGDIGVEPLYELFNRIMGLFTHNKYVYLFILTVFSVLPVMMLIKKYSSNPFLSIFLYISFSVGMSMFFLSFSMLRQFLAIGLYSLGIYFYIENKQRFNKKVILTLLCMVLCHYSSLIVLALLALDKYTLNKKFYWVVLFFSVFFGLLINIFFPYLEMFATMTGTSFYLTSNIDNSSYSFVSKLPFLFIYGYILYFSSKEIYNSFWVKGLFLAVCFGNILTFGTNADRICSYFYLTALIAVPYSLEHLKVSQYLNASYLVIVIAYFTYKYYVTFDIVKDSLYILAPYKSCF